MAANRVTDAYGGWCGNASPALPSSCRRRRVLANTTNTTNATNTTPAVPTTSVVNLYV